MNEEIVGRIGSQAGKQYVTLISALISLYLTKNSVNKPAEVISSDVAESLKKTTPSSTEECEVLAAEDETLFVERLTRLLKIDALDLSAKASSVLGEYATIFSDARILTDVRPLFTGSPDAPIVAGSVVVHTLRIGYRQNGEAQEIFIALDTDDMKSLETCITRALLKEKELEREVNGTKLGNLVR